MLMLLFLMLMFEPAAPAQDGDAMVYVATYIDIQVNSTAQGTRLVLQYSEASRREPGNARLGAFHEIGRPNRLVILETWKNQASFEAHERTEHTAQFRSALQAIHNSPFDQRVHQGFAIDPRKPAVGSDVLAVVTHVDVPPQRREETELLLKGLAEESRKDEGNVLYEVFQQSPARTNHFTVFAVWKDRKAFDSHEVKAHTRQFREALGPMLGALYDERLYTPLN
jgi:quinol monooxygenase YgiN